MKKIFFIFLLLGSVILPGCGGDEYEDPSPRVMWTSPANGETGVTESGQVLTVKFTAPMIPETINMGSVSVIDSAGRSWPAVDTATGAIVVNSVTTTPSEDATMFTFEQDGFFKSSSCFKLEISQNVRSQNNKPMEAPYSICFCTDGGDGTCPP